jgi:hypothetical protein
VLAVGSKLGLILFDNFVLLDVSTRSLQGGREVGLMRDLGYGSFASLISIDKRLASGLYAHCFRRRAGNRFAGLLVNLRQRSVLVLLA